MTEGRIRSLEHALTEFFCDRGYDHVLAAIEWDDGSLSGFAACDVRITLRLTDGASTTVLLGRHEVATMNEGGVMALLIKRITEALKPALKRGSAPWQDPPRHKADVGEYVIGYRRWKVVAEQRIVGNGDVSMADVNWSFEELVKRQTTPTWNYQLLPISVGGPWAGANEVMATCQYRTHPAPSARCDCGFNCWHEPQRQVRAMLRRPSTGFEASVRGLGTVDGVVRARGRIEVAHNGFRAQYAQPIALGYLDGEEDAVKALAKALGLAAVPMDDLPAYAQEHGIPVPVKLRPKPGSF